jgi:hypothetical protein
MNLKNPKTVVGKALVLVGIVGTGLVGQVGVGHAAYDTVSAASYNRLCPRHIGGDREYNGHGPEVTTAVRLERLGGRLSLRAEMHQIETVADWSEAQLTKDIKLAERLDGTQYTHIWAPNSSGVWGWRSLPNGVYDSWNDFYVDTNHSLRTVYPPDWWLSRVASNGDTGGNDIGNCTADDAYLNVSHSTLYVWFS